MTGFSVKVAKRQMRKNEKSSKTGRERLMSNVLSVIFLETFVFVKFKIICFKIILKTTFSVQLKL